MWGRLSTKHPRSNRRQTRAKLNKDIAKKLARLDGGRSTVAGMLIDDGFYEGGDAEALARILKLRSVYVDIDEEETVVCFDTGTDDGYMQGDVHVELFGELFEITGWVE